MAECSGELGQLPGANVPDLSTPAGRAELEGYRRFAFAARASAFAALGSSEFVNAAASELEDVASWPSGDAADDPWPAADAADADSADGARRLSVALRVADADAALASLRNLTASRSVARLAATHFFARICAGARHISGSPARRLPTGRSESARGRAGADDQRGGARRQLGQRRDARGRDSSTAFDRREHHRTERPTASGGARRLASADRPARSGPRATSGGRFGAPGRARRVQRLQQRPARIREPCSARTARDAPARRARSVTTVAAARQPVRHAGRKQRQRRPERARSDHGGTRDERGRRARTVDHAGRGGPASARTAPAPGERHRASRTRGARVGPRAERGQRRRRAGHRPKRAVFSHRRLTAPRLRTAARRARPRPQRLAGASRHLGLARASQPRWRDRARARDLARSAAGRRVGQRGRRARRSRDAHPRSLVFALA